MVERSITAVLKSRRVRLRLFGKGLDFSEVDGSFYAGRGKGGSQFSRSYASEQFYAEMAEWPIAPVLKTGLAKANGGSTPSLCAKVLIFQDFFSLPFPSLVRADSIISALSSLLLLSMWE